ncbi:sigma-70 family RNA polymerase sigma factor [Thermosipho ferrireducens]|uniref:Sigma-70 family RNA polymerase sigma factor n=1 Tax=Thermosipho ferrireducens TaxID=2571116 RepID=A0ABX7S8I2_9BACT|nr:sigma factor [Thermosipho ferrireducens]QTA38504.1 sigma-70 family RNA polymerase sigma factor [Thermosipho ferrireducens]
MSVYDDYKRDVEMIAGRYYKRYGYKCESYEDLKQTIWYILLHAIRKFDGRGDERKFALAFVRNKLISIVKYNRKPPYCGNAPFTPLKMEYVSGDDENKDAFREIQGEYVV